MYVNGKKLYLLISPTVILIYGCMEGLTIHDVKYSKYCTLEKKTQHLLTL